MTPERIITYILSRAERNATTTLEQLEGVVVLSGFTTTQLYEALEEVHRDKRIRSRNLKGQVVYDQAPIPKTKTSRTHYAVTVDGAWVVPLYQYEQRDGILFCKCVTIQGKRYEWIKPSDVGLSNDYLPMPEEPKPSKIPF